MYAIILKNRSVFEIEMNGLRKWSNLADLLIIYYDNMSSQYTLYQTAFLHKSIAMSFCKSHVPPNTDYFSFKFWFTSYQLCVWVTEIP